MNNTCEYCKKDFKLKGSLTRHIKTSKNCLKLRSEEDDISTVCTSCNKKLSSKQRLVTHMKICKETNNMNDIKTQVKQLVEEVIQLKEKPTTIINNNTNNTDNSIKTVIHNYSSILDYKPEAITETFRKHYNSIEHLLKSDQRQLADMTVKHVLSGTEQPLYFVTDRSRNKFIYTDQENNEQEDSNATILRSLVYRGIKPIVKNIYHEEFKRLRSELADHQRRDSAVLIASTRDDLKELEEAYRQMDIIQESDDYISQLSRCLPTSIRDRIYKDNLQMKQLQDHYDSDEEFKRELEREVRMIGDYSAVELQKFKDLYKTTGETRGPPSITKNPKYLKEYIEFLAS